VNREPLPLRIEEGAALAPRTTLGVGGPARYFVEAKDEDDVVEALAWAKDRQLRVAVLGGGSNLLVADRGFDGLVLRPRLLGVLEQECGDCVRWSVGAGESWDGFVERTAAAGLGGVACLSGIPGDVGAAPIQNIGAYGQDVAETIASVRVVDRATGEVRDLDRRACAFGYRDSFFKQAGKDRFVVVSACFELARGAPTVVRYAELDRALGGRKDASPMEMRTTVRELRRQKSMLAGHADENARSAGSFFMNPVVSSDSADAIERRSGQTMPRFDAGQGLVKLSAGWLIERAGYVRGTASGSVGLSSRHALAIVNRGGATAAEVFAFAVTVRARVADRFGIALVAEPVLLGFDDEEARALAAL